MGMQPLVSSAAGPSNAGGFGSTQEYSGHDAAW